MRTNAYLPVDNLRAFHQCLSAGAETNRCEARTFGGRAVGSLIDKVLPEVLYVRNACGKLTLLFGVRQDVRIREDLRNGSFGFLVTLIDWLEIEHFFYTFQWGI